MCIVASRHFVEVSTVDTIVARYHYSFGQSRVFGTSSGHLLSMRLAALVSVPDLRFALFLRQNNSRIFIWRR